jgi:hypothetical protein
MYVSRDKSQAVVFAFSLNSDHWSNLVPRLLLQGLLPDAEYEVSEPLPNNITQASGNLMIIETEGTSHHMWLHLWRALCAQHLRSCAPPMNTVCSLLQCRCTSWASTRR